MIIIVERVPSSIRPNRTVLHVPWCSIGAMRLPSLISIGAPSCISASIELIHWRTVASAIGMVMPPMAIRWALPAVVVVIVRRNGDRSPVVIAVVIVVVVAPGSGNTLFKNATKAFDIV